MIRRISPRRNDPDFDSDFDPEKTVHESIPKHKNGITPFFPELPCFINNDFRALHGPGPNFIVAGVLQLVEES